MTSNPPPPGPPFRPAVQPQQGQPFFPGASQQFRPVGQGIPSSNIGMPAGQNQFSQPVHQFPQWPGQPGHAATQTMPVPYAQPARPLMSGSSQSQPTVPIHGLGATGIPQSSPYPFGPPSFGQTQPNSTAVSQFMPMSQMHAPAASVAGQPWLPVASQTATIVTPVQSNGQQLSSTNSLDLAADVANSTQHSSSDWQEHVASDGRRYYYNKKTGKSSWEKPVELMTPIERADASTVWKEFTTPEGKKYYYNKVTKESKWTLPEELKFAREQAQQTAHQGVMSEVNVASQGPAAAISVGTNASTSLSLPSSSPASTTPVVTGVANPPQAVVSGPSAIPVVHSTVTSAAGVQPPVVTGTSLPTIVSGSTGVPSAPGSANTTPSPGFDNLASQGAATNGPSTQNAEEVRQGTAASGNTNPPMSEGKAPDDDDEPLVFATKQEAKNAFKALLESVNVQSDWTWEQTMREISNDKRYSALKTLGERKQTFNEYLGQKKKHEAEERRLRQKKAREEFTKMLEESKELTSSMKWSKAASLFESDERFKAVDRARDREDLFDTYIVELERKEKERAAEDHRQNVEEFKKFLKSCDFIKVNSQWRKIQDRLEDDERCLRLEKIDRLIIFQDYIRDLEKEEEDAKKMQKEQLRRAERKNRDAFRKLMEEHISSGFLTAKTRWLDYCQKVKDSPEYLAVAANTSGSRPKDLFEDVMEDLEKQYHDDKSRMKDSIKVGKISMVSTWTMEDFKAAVSAVGSPPISDINVKLLYEEMMERAKEKEEKEAKKRQRLADDFTKLLHTFKEITPSSDWEECKPLFEESEEYRSIGEESVRRDIFQDYITHLLEKAKEKERKREEEKAKKDKEREEKEKRKEKERKEKDREREKGKERSKKDDTDSENVDGTDSHGHREEKRREKDKDKKHRKRHRNTNDDASSDKDEKEESRKSRSHGSDRKKSRKHAHSPESDGESRHKKHRRDHRDGSRRNSGHDDLEDGELGEDGEIR